MSRLNQTRAAAARARLLVTGLGLLLAQASMLAQTVVEHGSSKLIGLNESGTLVYAVDARGNRLPDFSYVGYHSGERAIPDVPVRLTLAPADGDDTPRIQNALDQLGRLPADARGHRGALLLKRGTYRVEGSLRLTQSGVVLRGEGSGPDGTLIVAAGYGQAKYKRALL